MKIKVVSVWLLAWWLFLPKTVIGQGFPNVEQTPGALLTSLLGTDNGRMAIIAYHNGWLYTSPESPDSLAGSDILARRWNIANLGNVYVEEVLGTSPQAVNAHGYFNVGDRLVLGANNAGSSWSFRAVSPGVNTRGALPGLGNAGVRGALYYPWFINPTYWSYNAVEGNAELSLRGEVLASWDHLGLTGVIGHPFIVGNLLIFASDQSRTGVATYDISDPTNPRLLDVLKTGGPGGYWPELWGGDGKLYVVFPYRENGRGMRVVDVTNPEDIRFLADVPLPGDEPMYAQFQDEYAFIGSHKVDMRSMQSVLTFNTAAQGVDASQFALPLGNLLVTGGVGEFQGMAIWAHQAAPDTRGPSVGFHIPRAGQTNYPVGLPISLLIHETLETHTITVGENFIVRPVGGSSIAGTVTFAFDDTLTFTPDQPLLPNTTYEVVIPAGGIRDAANNGIEGYSFTFSTGTTVNGNLPPSITSFTATPYPVEPDQAVTFQAAATDPEADTLNYRFDFGDGSARTEWGIVTSANHSYTNAGHYQAKVQVRDTSGVITTRTVTVTVMPPLPAGNRPVHSSQIVTDTARRTVWTVNPDNNSVRSINADTLVAGSEITVGADPRNVAVDAAGNVWVTCHDADRIDILLAAGGTQTIPLLYGSAPFGVVMSHDGLTAYVSLTGSGQLMRFNTVSRSSTGVLALGPTPRAMALTADGARLFVTRFISPLHRGEVWEVNAETMTLIRTLGISKFGGESHRDGTAEGKGIANHLAGIALSPDGTQLFITGNKMNTDRGTLTDAELTQDNTVRNIVVVMNATSGLVTDTLDIDNSDSASAVTFSPLGDYFFVTLQGNNEVAVFDRLAVNSGAGLGGFITRHGVGRAPQGVSMDPITRRVFISDFMSRTVSVLELNQFLSTGALNIPTTTVQTVSTDLLPPAVLRGKQLFYDASDVRMSAEGYISCATCHNDGGQDGQVWDFTGRGEGLRRTISLRGRSGLAHGNVHWSANFDEIQDFEHDIRNAFGGAGFLTNEQFATVNDPLGTPKAGMDEDLDALAAYVASLGNEQLPRSPYRNPDGSLTTAGQAGRALFTLLNCNSCHAGPTMTDEAFHDVGTLRATSGRRLNLPLSGIETPTLRGLWGNAPYLHDGSAATLEDVFVVSGGTLYEAANGLRGGAAELHNNGGDIYANYDSAVRGRAMVTLRESSTLTFNDVNGGTGGVGALEIRYSNSSATSLLIRVNGVEHLVNLPAVGNNPTWRHTVWMTRRIEGIALAAGANNTIELVTSGFANLSVDDVLAATANDLQQAQAHRQVLGLTEQERAELMAYLRELDGSPVENGPAAPPAISLHAPVDAQLNGFSTQATVRFELQFSRMVSGLTASDIQLSGTTGAQTVSVVTINPGRSYRLEVADMLQAGTIGLQVIANAAQDQAGLGTAASELVSIQWQPQVDDLAPLSDEFSNAAALANWQSLNQTEGWGINQLEGLDVNTSTAGHMRFMPHTVSWYMNSQGPLLYKEITGDFIATMRLNVRRRNGQPGRPVSAWSFGGLMIRTPRNITAAGPNPEASSATRLPWPPSGFTSDWTPDGENDVGISLGSPYAWMNPNPNQWAVSTRSTVNGNTSVNWGTQDVPEGSSWVTFQAVRKGSTILLLRRHDGGEWIVAQRFQRTDMPATVQVGLFGFTDFDAMFSNNLYADRFDYQTAYHHNRNVISAANGFTANPDLVVDADYIRFQRPPELLTEQNLLALPMEGGTRWLAGTAVENLLGEASNVANVSTLPGGAMTFSHFATAAGIVANPLADADGDGQANFAEWALGGTDPGDANESPSVITS
ncbi:MAG: Ig-like domain-containing protein, partial [Verrucomicrobiota bacterium]